MNYNITTMSQHLLVFASAMAAIAAIIIFDDDLSVIDTEYEGMDVSSFILPDIAKSFNNIW